MAKLIRSIPCVDIIIDKDSNTVSYMHMVEGLLLPEGEAFPSILIGTLWESTKKNDKLTMRARISTPDGNEHTAKEFAVEFGEYKRYRINVRVPSFPVREAGNYRITIEHRGRKNWVKDDEFSLQLTFTEDKPAKTT